MHIVQEERTMSRPSAFKRNYSHCPLKKRPVQVFVKEEVSDRAHEDGSDDNSEPENLSTKPEDLSLGCKALTPPHGVALITAGVKEEVVSGTGVGGARPPALIHPLSHFLSKGAPLEPLSLNTPAPWQGYYPSHYLPPSSYYPYPEVYPSYYPGAEKTAPVAAYPRPSSPPQRRFAPLPQPRPVYVHYSPPHQHQEGVAPAFYSGPPPATPEDLSSPGSAASSSSTSSSPPPRRQRSKEVSPRYQCSFCSKSYSTYSGLSKHQQFHCSANEDSAAKKTFSCKHCDKVYVSLGALKMHIRTHTLPCKCRLCGKAFSRPWLLQGHIRTHTGEKPFTCPHCNRAFADRSNLRAHLQTHSDVKKYSCPTCSKTFSRMSLLSKHCEGGCPGLASPSCDETSSYRTEPLSPS